MTVTGRGSEASATWLTFDSRVQHQREAGAEDHHDPPQDGERDQRLSVSSWS